MLGKKRYIAKFKTASQLLGLLTAVAGTMILLGWCLDIRILTNSHPDTFHYWLVLSSLVMILLMIIIQFFNAKLVRDLDAERRQGEQTLRISENHYRSLFERSINAIFLVDLRSGKYLDANQAAEELTGRKVEELRKLTTSEVTPAGAARRIQQLSKAVGGENLGEIEYLRPDGSKRSALLSAVPLGNGLGFGIALDITERKQAEEAMRNSEILYRGLFESSQDAIMTLEPPDWKFTSGNQATIEMFRAKDELDFTSRGPWMLSPEFQPEGQPSGSKAKEMIEAAMRDGSRFFEWTHRRIDGQDFPANVLLTRVTVSGKTFLQATVRDVTELKQAEKKILQLNVELEQKVEERTAELKRRMAELEIANQELETFSYSVSHDLRSPLQNIYGYAHVLKEDRANQLDAKSKELLDRIYNSIRKMFQLIDDMLNLAKITSTEIHLSRVDLSALAWQVVTGLRDSQPDRRVEFVIAPGMTIDCDPALLKIALDNLLGNAWKFTSAQTRAKIEIGQSEREGRPVFFVRDDGVGFNMEQAHKLFTPFQRLHLADEFPGTGVGLATVQRVIHRHGGRVWGEGAVGKGATFYFTLS
ncbi:MAG: PAS domain S-box protein [Candidatus Margulisiibacteriota bacterium]|jgi:PAS domain S-box-containing protein